MKLEDIQIGRIYDIKVGSNTTAVRIMRLAPKDGWEAVTLSTNKTLVIKSASRVIGLHNPKADKKADAGVKPAASAPAAPAEGKKHLSALDAAAKVLTQAGTPMTCKQMMDAMVADGLWQPAQGGKTPANTLHAAIGLEIKKKGDAARFEKVGRGQFGLRSQ